MHHHHNLDDLIRKTYAPEVAGYKAPGLQDIKARRRVLSSHNEASDLFNLLAVFLNMKVKLVHAVIAFLIIWFALLLTSGDEEVQVNDAISQPYVSNMAVTHGTVPSCIQTYVLKK
jgi:hypothetical protein